MAGYTYATHQGPARQPATWTRYLRDILQVSISIKDLPIDMMTIRLDILEISPTGNHSSNLHAAALVSVSQGKADGYRSNILSLMSIAPAWFSVFNIEGQDLISCHVLELVRCLGAASPLRVLCSTRPPPARPVCGLSSAGLYKAQTTYKLPLIHTLPMYVIISPRLIQ
jgi:hypothetical protein